MENKNGNLGCLLKCLLGEKSLSVSKLSKLSGVDKATLSRIINNKQKANINHLEKISLAISVPLESLLESVGYNVKSSGVTQESENIKELVIGEDYNEIESLIKITSYLKNSELEKIIIKELRKYKDFAKTEEGIVFIHENFKNKMEGTKGSGVFLENLNQMYEKFCKEEINSEESALIGSALLYFITSTDIIPDFIVPIGFLDDYLAMNLIEKLISNYDNREEISGELI